MDESCSDDPPKEVPGGGSYSVQKARIHGYVVEHLRSRFGTMLREAKRLLRTQQQGGRSYHQLGDEVARLVDLVYRPDNTDSVKV